MWYKSVPGSYKGVPRVKNYHVAFYDMTRDGGCFDETFYKPEEIDKAIVYAETVEDEGRNYRTRVFVHMDDGDIYELKLVKLTKGQVKYRTTCYFNG